MEKIKILHTSDIHGEILNILFQENLKDFDIWVDTGDFFSDYFILKIIGNKPQWVVDKKRSNIKQREWLKESKIIEKMSHFLNGRPFISVSGNHDFISLAESMRKAGYKNVYEIDPEGFELNGIKFAGFPNINETGSGWNFETCHSEFQKLKKRIEKSCPDILLTHSPPRGILDEGYNCQHFGVDVLSMFFSWSKHKVKIHMFGHVHEPGGKQYYDPNLKVLFINGATKAIIHEISLDKMNLNE